MTLLDRLSDEAHLTVKTFNSRSGPKRARDERRGHQPRRRLFSRVARHCPANSRAQRRSLLGKGHVPVVSQFDGHFLTQEIRHFAERSTTPYDRTLPMKPNAKDRPMSYRQLTTACIISLVAYAAACAETALSAIHRGELTSAVDQHIRKSLDDLLAYYKDLHKHPELSLEERESARKIAERLKSAGYTVTTGVGGHGVVGVLANGPGPTILIRGDMDALPITEETGLPYRSEVKVERDDGAHVGVMHACGHDIHQACLAGTAKVLAELKDRWSGTIVAIAQPAEEIGVGALAMINDGLFERFPKPDFCISLHVSSDQPAGEVGYTSGWNMANVDSVDITIHGRGGHGSRPQQTVDPIATAAQVITALQTIVSRNIDPVEPGVITVGSIHAGSKHNIIPDTATLQITVRSYTDENRRVLLDGIRRVTTNVCRAMGCPKDPEVVIRENEFTPAAYNDPALTEAAVGVLKHLLGADQVIAQKARMGGEDFGRYARHLRVPGFMFWLGSVPRDRYETSLRPSGAPLPSIHSSKYYPDPEPTITTGVRSLASIALALLNKRE